MSRRAAIYARYSTDKQREASIVDQTNACREYAQKYGWTVAATYADAAISGASAINRPDFQRLMMDAAAGKFDVVIVHAIDRLGRRLADVADLYDRLNFNRIRLDTPELGELNQMVIGFLATMAQVQLKLIGNATKSAQAGRVKLGKSAGGKAYGYDVLPAKQVGNKFERGDRAINAAQVEIVRRIFEEYANGKSPEEIARDLNKEGIPGPGGRVWQNTTIRGQAKRGTGILNNALYIGWIKWNRCSFSKNPATGKRRAWVNDESTWTTVEVDHLRIVDDALWIRVKKRQQEIRDKVAAVDAATKNPLNGAHRPQYVLSGKLICGCCGGGFTILNATSYGCSRRKRSGTCDNRHTIKRSEIEARVLGGIKDKLMNETLLVGFVAAVEAEVAEGVKVHGQDRKVAEKTLKKIVGEIENMMEVIKGGFFTDSMREELTALEGRKIELIAELAAPAPAAPKVDLPSDWQSSYRAAIDELETSLDDPDTKDAAMTVLRDLIDEVVLEPGVGDTMRAKLSGVFPALLELAATASRASGKKKTRRESAGRSIASSCEMSVVAGIGFEPMTFRL